MAREAVGERVREVDGVPVGVSDGAAPVGVAEAPVASAVAVPKAGCAGVGVSEGAGDRVPDVVEEVEAVA